MKTQFKVEICKKYCVGRTTLPVFVKAKTKSDFVIKVVQISNMKATTYVKNGIKIHNVDEIIV